MHQTLVLAAESAIDPTFQLSVEFLAMILALISFSYAFHARGMFFILPESIYIGGITAHALLGIYKGLKTTAFDYIAQGQIQLIIPIIIGLLAFTRLTRYRWAARYPVALMTGAGTGALFGLTIKGQVFAQIRDTVLIAFNVAYDPISRILVVAFLVPIIMLFLYSQKLSGIFHDRGARFEWVSRIGRLIFMIFLAQKAGMAYTAGTDLPVKLVQQVIKPVLEKIFGL